MQTTKTNGKTNGVYKIYKNMSQTMGICLWLDSQKKQLSIPFYRFISNPLAFVTLSSLLLLLLKIQEIVKKQC
jgi:hypothetical protein